jgi:hopene-associated glycosyltransferase HpnB
VLTVLGSFATVVWLAVLLHPARPWDLRPVGEDEPEPADPLRWPSVTVVVPARNEARVLPDTLPALLSQDYPGEWQVAVVDDRSDDGTGEVAAAIFGRRREAGAGIVAAAVVTGEPLPDGWAGKVWALEQGLARALEGDSGPEYLLLTDADIRHGPSSLRRLVAEAEVAGLGLNSRMARLRCQSGAERLLIPPFVFFFNLLYPMRQVNDPGRRTAAAAGGCMLVRRDALEQSGGFAAIRREIIDDVNLARRVKAVGAPLRLATSRNEVTSLREYGSLGAVWRMVRRTAFDQLRYSWLLLAATFLLLMLLFLLPPALVALAVALGVTGATSAGWALAVGLIGLAAWALMAVSFVAAVRFFGLRRLWALTLPVAGVLYGGMTLDSALQHRRGRSVW